MRHRIELGGGIGAHDVLGAPLASVSELRYPDIASDALGTVLALADGGSLATWQGAGDLREPASSRPSHLRTAAAISSSSSIRVRA